MTHILNGFSAKIVLLIFFISTTSFYQQQTFYAVEFKVYSKPFKVSEVI